MTASSIDQNPRFRRLADYLAAKAPPGKLPGRQHIDPLEIPDLLSWIMLIDVLPKPAGERRYRIRLMGTEVVAIQGADETGKYMEDVLTGDAGAEIVHHCDEMLLSHEPYYRRGVVATTGREHVHYERIAFPLSSDGERVDMLILVFAKIEKPASSEGAPPAS